MQILLVAATETEIQPFIAGNSHIDVLITGVGVPSALYHLQKKLQQAGYDFVIQAGIAGAFSDDIPLGQTVLVKQDCFADVGMETKENFTTIFEAGFADKNGFPFENGWLVNKNELLKQTSLTAVNAITVNKVSDSILQKQQFLQKFNAQIESMEGAALHYVCLQENLPFLQIRSISNYVGERDKTKWKMKEAIEGLNVELGKIVSGLMRM